MNESRNTINPRQRNVIILMDVLLILELMLAIYLGYQDRPHLSAIFLRTYVPLALVTVLTCRYFIRRFGRSTDDGAKAEAVERAA